MIRFTALLAAAIVSLPSGHTADVGAQNAFLDPGDAGEDFDFQGEYSGTLQRPDGKLKIGLQVIAQGGGQFKAAAFIGGLPGDGWDGTNRINGEGKVDDGTLRILAEPGGTAEIAAGVVAIRSADGDELGILKKIFRKSPSLGANPVANATVLFDGTSADNFIGGRLTDDGLLQQGATTKQKFQDFTFHTEFQLSFMPWARGQRRSNSGCYMQGRYEVQILDSFGLAGEHNECGGIYEVRKPDLNMCFPPLSWQTYDVDFTAAKFDENGIKTSSARMTVRHNGIVIHDSVEVPRSTRAAPLGEGPMQGPVYIQDHGNPLRFRNIWVVAAVESDSAVPDQDAFQSIFDGKTLNGWHVNSDPIGHGTGGRWYVGNGAITGEQDPPGSGNGGILLTDKKYGNFELMIDMKPDWGVCSGLFVRSNEKGQCFQMMVDYHDAGNVGHIYGEGTGGFQNRVFNINGVYNRSGELTKLSTEPLNEQLPPAYSCSGEEWLKVWKVNDWNTSRVRVVGNPPRITTWLNGQKISDFDGATFDGPRYDREDTAARLGSQGSIAVQVHGGKGWPKGAKCRWKNIRVREL